MYRRARETEVWLPTLHVESMLLTVEMREMHRTIIYVRMVANLWPIFLLSVLVHQITHYLGGISTLPFYFHFLFSTCMPPPSLLFKCQSRRFPFRSLV